MSIGGRGAKLGRGPDRGRLRRGRPKSYVLPAGLPPGPALPLAIAELTVVDVAPAGVVPDGILPAAAPAFVSVPPAGMLPDGMLDDAAGAAGAGATVVLGAGGGGGAADAIPAVGVTAATARSATNAAVLLTVLIPCRILSSRVLVRGYGYRSGLQVCERRWGVALTSNGYGASRRAKRQPRVGRYYKGAAFRLAEQVSVLPDFGAARPGIHRPRAQAAPLPYRPQNNRERP